MSEEDTSNSEELHHLHHGPMMSNPGGRDPGERDDCQEASSLTQIMVTSDASGVTRRHQLPTATSNGFPMLSSTQVPPG
jgi:hypothetical protein